MKQIVSFFLFAAAACAQCPNETSVQWAYVPVSGYFVSMSNSGAMTINQCAQGQIKVLWTAPQFADAEVPGGTLDGKNKVFTLAHKPQAGSVPVVVLNGLVQKPTTDYTLSGATLTLIAAPDAAALLEVWYRY